MLSSPFSPDTTNSSPCQVFSLVLYFVSTNAGIILFLLIFDFISPTLTSIDTVIIFNQIMKDLFGIRKKEIFNLVYKLDISYYVIFVLNVIIAFILQFL